MNPGGAGWGGGNPPGGGVGAPPGAGGWGSPPGGGPPGGGAWGTPPVWGGGPEPKPPPGYGGTTALHGGVPWEQSEGGLFSRWWETVKACNGDTRAFFAATAQNESGNALTFAMMTGAMVGAAIGLFYLLLFTFFSAAIMAGLAGIVGKSSAGAGAVAAGISIGIGLVYAVIVAIGAAVGSVIRPFVWGGIHHVILLLVGGIGPQRSFMHTVRVAAYTEGAAFAWMFIPIAGPFIAPVFVIKNLVQGYDEVHGSGVGKALLAIFAPVLCCCACYLMLALMGLAGSLGAAGRP